MPDWSITITKPSTQTQFTPDPITASVNDTISWANETSDKHQLAINGVPFTDVINPWESSSPAYVCQASATITYTCVIPGHTETGTIKIASFLLCLLLFGLFATPARAQSSTAPVDCGPIVGKALQPIPEIGRSGNFVRGTLVTAGANEMIPFVQGAARQSGSMLNSDGTVNTNMIKCYQQWVRAYSKDAPRGSQDATATYITPLPGPTIRARVGDVVELTFLNLIEPLRFTRSDLDKCDQSSTYPANVKDQYPDCFNESIITNVHFHGTHTNPSSTGDNVFLQVKPSPRSADAARKPSITADTVKASFKAFFDRCEMELRPPVSTPKQWPRLWSQAPKEFTAWADATVEQYALDWYIQNQNAVLNGAWPQNYVGAVPYCFPLPAYPQGSPAANTAAAQSPHTHGAGAAEIDETQAPARPLVMGQAPGTHWYHAHKHGSTTINVSNGMTGVMIVEGQYDDEINQNYSNQITQQLLVIQQLGGLPNLERARGGADPYFSVNGQLQPVITMRPGEVQWWRIANTSSRAGVYFLPPTTAADCSKATSALAWKQLAQDGVQFNNTNYNAPANNCSAFLLASGNRADLLVKAPPLNSDPAKNSYSVLVYNTVDPADRSAAAKPVALTLLTVNVAGANAGMTFMPNAPTFPPFLGDIPAGDVKATRTLTFSTNPPTTPGGQPTAPGKPGTHEIDGVKFDGNVGAAVVLNQVEEWKIVNQTYGSATSSISHPFHIHINPFQVVEVFDPNATVNNDGKTPVYVTTAPGAGQCPINPADPTTWKPCANVTAPSNIWWDVFPIPSGKIFGTTPIPGYFKMRSRFVDFAGYYVLHCHILAHEDRGMMTVVYVTPLQPPFSHH